MSKLLKTVFKNLLGKSTPHCLGCVSFGFSDYQSNKLLDPMTSTIKSAADSATILETVQRHMPNMNHKHLLQALRSIFEIQRCLRCKEQNEQLVKDPAFSTLCQNLKKHARALELNEAIEATKVLLYLHVPIESVLVQTLLQLIRSNINFIDIRQVMFLDFLLSKYDNKSHLVDALKLALPLVFQIHLPLELDDQDLPLLKNMLVYSVRNKLPDRCINNIVTCLLLHDQVINPPIAKAILWGLCEVNCTEERFPTRAQLLQVCFDVLIQGIDSLSYEEILRTVGKLKARISEKHPEYYHEGFMDAAAHYVVNKSLNFEKGILIARALSRIAHTNLKLVSYICDVATSKPYILAEAPTNLILGFVNCLSNSNYIPETEQWEEIKRQISSNPVLESKNPNLPWTKFCLELVSLGIYEEKLLRWVFSAEFLEQYLSRENNTLDYLQLLTLSEAVKTFANMDYGLNRDLLEIAKKMYPAHSINNLLMEHFARGLGGNDYVTKNIQLDNGFVIDVLLCFKCGEPIKLPQSSKVKTPIKELNLPQDAITVCVINFNQGCYSINSHRLRGVFKLIIDILEKQGYVTVPLDLSQWQNLLSAERTPYLMREVSYKCEEIGLKLRALND